MRIGCNRPPYTRRLPPRARKPGIIGGMDLIELSRRLENLIRFGTIHSVDHAARRCRVKSGDLVTQWLRWMELRAGDTKTWNPPTVGEQCVVFSPSGEPAGGMVFYGAPSDIIDTPSHSPDDHVTRYPDGTVIRYDHAAGIHEAIYPDGAEIRYNHQSSHLEATGINTLLAQADTSITFDTPLVHCTGKLTTDDLLTYGNGINGTGGSNNNIVTGQFTHNGTFTHTGGNLSSNGKVLHTHTHTGVTPGGGNTGAPA